MARPRRHFIARVSFVAAFFFFLPFYLGNDLIIADNDERRSNRYPVTRRYPAGANGVIMVSPGFAYRLQSRIVSISAAGWNAGAKTRPIGKARGGKAGARSRRQRTTMLASTRGVRHVLLRSNAIERLYSTFADENPPPGGCPFAKGAPWASFYHSTVVKARGRVTASA